MVTKRGLKIIVTSLKGKSRIKVQVDGQKLDRIGWKRTVWKWTVFDLIHMNMNEIIISILSFTINLQWFINNQWFVVTWSRYRLNDYRNRTGKEPEMPRYFKERHSYYYFYMEFMPILHLRNRFVFETII